MIERFRDENFFLSNMYPLKVPILTSQGIEVWSAEHRYQAEKFETPYAHELVATIHAGLEPSRQDGITAKDMAHVLEAIGEPLRPDLLEARLDIMRETIRLKFMNDPDLQEALLATMGQELVEGNIWKDRFWGVWPPPSQGGSGENHLGIQLMELREGLVEYWDLAA